MRKLWRSGLVCCCTAYTNDFDVEDRMAEKAGAALISVTKNCNCHTLMGELAHKKLRKIKQWQQDGISGVTGCHTATKFSTLLFCWRLFWQFFGS